MMRESETALVHVEVRLQRLVQGPRLADTKKRKHRRAYAQVKAVAWPCRHTQLWRTLMRKLKMCQSKQILQRLRPAGRHRQASKRERKRRGRQTLQISPIKQSQPKERRTWTSCSQSSTSSWCAPYLALIMHPSEQLNPPAHVESSQCTVFVMRLTTTVRCASERA